VGALLGPGRKDESGDFTRGAELGDVQISTIMAFVNASAIIKDQLEDQFGSETGGTTFDVLGGRRPARENERRPGTVEEAAKANASACKYLSLIVGDSEIGQEGIRELETISNLLSAQGYGPDRIVIDPSVVRGLGYYTGPVFEAELTFDILDEKGRPRQFGSVAGGGRYDDLVKRFTGQSVPATGVSIGVDRLLAALRAKGRAGTAVQGPVVVTVMDRDRMADYMAMAAELRRAGVRAEVYLGNPKNFGNQLKYADKRASPVAVIQGSAEAEQGMVILKDLIEGARIAAGASLDEWKQRPAQKTVKRADLVAEVRKMLG
jgi:histidyl-tRNA synthetase